MSRTTGAETEHYGRPATAPGALVGQPQTTEMWQSYISGEYRRAPARDALLIAGAWLGFLTVLWNPSLHIAVFAAGLCLTVPAQRTVRTRIQG